MTRRAGRAERKQAKAAIAAAERAEQEARSLAGLLPRGSVARERMSRAVADASAARRAAEQERRSAPFRAAHRALRATARLERAAHATLPGDAADRRRAGRRTKAKGGAAGSGPAVAIDAKEAKARAKARAKVVKARRKQLARVQGWAKSIATSVAAHSITVPTDAEAARKAAKRRQRAAKPTRG